MRTILVAALGAFLTLTAFAVEVGKPSPAFTIQRLSGPALQLSQYKGKVVALAFISTTCPHCQNLTKLLNVISKEYASKGVQVVACAFNDNVKGLLPEFLQTVQPTFPVGYCERDAVMAYLQASVVKAFYVPHMVFLDRSGVVKGDFAGESDFMTQQEMNIRTELDQLLHGATTTSAAARKQ